MQIAEVHSQRDWKDFHQVAHYIYRRDPHWISPIYKDIEKTFDPASNKVLAHGEAKVWLLRNDAGKPIGRIAAFFDAKRNSLRDFPLGSMGFFECINNDEAADLLFDTAENYLRERGMKAIDGPVNFGERDRFWGLLTKGWYQPIYQENYHPPYYMRFFERRNYQPQEQIFTYSGRVENFHFDRILGMGQKIRERYGVTTRAIDPGKLDEFAGYFAEVYNQAFRDFPYFKPLQQAQVAQVFQQMKPVMDPRLVCFSFADGKPVGFCALMPEINDFLRYAGGKLNIWTLPRFLWRKFFLRPQKIKGVAFGIVPEWQRRGLFACIVEHLYLLDNRANAANYDQILLATIRGHNQAMNNVVQNLAVKVQRVHLAYRKMLVDDIPFEALPFSDTSEVEMGEVPDVSIYPRD